MSHTRSQGMNIGHFFLFIRKLYNKYSLHNKILTIPLGLLYKPVWPPSVIAQHKQVGLRQTRRSNSYT